MAALIVRLRLFSLPHRRLLSAAASPPSPTRLTGKRRSRAALSLLKSEEDPSRIISILRSAAPNPSSSALDRAALSIAVSKLSHHPTILRSYLDDQNDLFRPHAILLFGQAGMLDDAIRTFKSSPTLPSLNALLSVAAKHGEAARIFRDFPSSYNLTPSLDTYNILIKSFSESGSSGSIYKVFDEMSRRRVKPNMTTFCNALAVFYSEKRLGDVDRVLDLMRRSDLDCCSLAVYNARIKGLCKINRSSEAKALFKEMVSIDVKPDWVTYSTLVIGFCKEGNLGDAMRVYKEMKIKGCVANAAFYFALIYHLCEGEEFGLALEVCRETMERNKVPCFSTMKMLVNGLARDSNVEVAREIVGKMKEKFPGSAGMWKDVEDGLPL